MVGSGRFCAGAGELGEEVPPAAKQRPQQARDGQHHAAVRDGSEQAVLEKAALEELPQHLLPDEAGGPHAQQLFEVLLDQTEKAPRGNTPRFLVFTPGTLAVARAF